MWNRSENAPPRERASSEAKPPQTVSPPAPEAPKVQRSVSAATIGPSIRIQGDLSGEEDLLIEGRVEGKINLQKQSVTVGGRGRVKADIHARSICVEGEVKGNLFGEEQVTICKSGKVEGNATAPQVSLENGSQFRGTIDMQPQRAAANSPAAGGKKAAR